MKPQLATDFGIDVAVRDDLKAGDGTPLNRFSGGGQIFSDRSLEGKNFNEAVIEELGDTGYSKECRGKALAACNAAQARWISLDVNKMRSRFHGLPIRPLGRIETPCG